MNNFDLVSTPNGKGRIQWLNTDGTLQVWILRHDYKPDGVHHPACNVNDMSPTIPVNFAPEEITRI